MIGFDELIFSFRTMHSPYLAFFTPFRGFSDCRSCGMPVKVVVMITEKTGVCPDCYEIGGKLNASQNGSTAQGSLRGYVGQAEGKENGKGTAIRHSVPQAGNGFL